MPFWLYSKQEKMTEIENLTCKFFLRNEIFSLFLQKPEI